MVVEALLSLGAVLVMCLGPLLLFWRALFGSASLRRAYRDTEAVKAAPVWVPSELEVSASRLRRARRLRREAEIASWEASFSALVVARGGCPVCAGRSHNH